MTGIVVHALLVLPTPAQPIHSIFSDQRGIQLHLNGHISTTYGEASDFFSQTNSSTNATFSSSLSHSINPSGEGVTVRGSATASQNSTISSNRISLTGGFTSSAQITGSSGEFDPHWPRIQSYGYSWASVRFWLSEYCRFSLTSSASSRVQSPEINATTVAETSLAFFGPQANFATNVQAYSSWGPTVASGSLNKSGYLNDGIYDVGIYCSGGPDLMNDNAAASSQASANLTLQLIPLGTRLAGWEVVQTIQDWDNSVPLIAGKPTFARVHLETMSAPAVPLMNPRLRGFGLMGEELSGSPLTPMPGSATVVLPNAAEPDRRAQWNSSLNFQLPPSWTTNFVRLEFSMTGLNYGPASRSVYFVASPKIELELVRVTVVGPDFTNAAPSVTSANTALAELARLYPVNEKRIQLAQRNLTLHTLSTKGLTAEELVEKLAAERTKEESSAIWIGAVQGTLPGVLAGVSDGIPGHVVAARVDNPLTLAHEVAHALGEFHTVSTQAFGVASYPVNKADPAFLPETNYAVGPCDMLAPLNLAVMYPYFDGNFARIGPLNEGTNRLVYGLEMLGSSPKIYRPESSVDLMALPCSGYEDVWISPHTYGRLHSAMSMRWWQPSMLTAPAGDVGDPQPYVLIRGLVNFSNNAVTLLPSLPVSLSTPPPWQSGNTHQLNIYRLEGNWTNLSQSISFTPRSTYEEGRGGNPQGGYFCIPVAGSLSNLVRVEVTQNSNVLASRNLSAAAPTIQILTPGGGETIGAAALLARWSASDTDGDTLTYRIEFSRDGGQSWRLLAADWPNQQFLLSGDMLASSTNARLRVLASDGLRITTSQSSATFMVANHAPQVAILSPTDRASVLGNAAVIFSAKAVDMDDGDMADGQIRWFSSRDGLLGQGALLETNGLALAEGEHTISVVVTDSMGATNAASLRFSVARFATAQITEFSSASGGSVQLSVLADPTGQHVLETSTNLTEWLPVSTNAPADGLFDFIRLAESYRQSEFFRIRTQPQ